MAIFGVGSIWGYEEEKKDYFFKENSFILGWNDSNAKDLYEAISLLKAGDILYLKSNQPGSRTIRVKGIGIITKSFIQCILDRDFKSNSINDWESLFVKVEWVYKDEFIIEIPSEEGKLTNIRAASFYEEYLPLVQKNILDKFISKLD